MPDAASYASQSDPDLNRHFRRRWSEALAGLPAPARLDREADAELMQGHVRRAEYLAQRAFALREDGR